MTAWTLGSSTEVLAASGTKLGYASLLEPSTTTLQFAVRRLGIRTSATNPPVITTLNIFPYHQLLLAGFESGEMKCLSWVKSK